MTHRGQIGQRALAFAAETRGRIAARRLPRTRPDGPGVRRVPPSSFQPALKRLASDCHSVLDIGTGMASSLADSPCPVRLGLDAHRPYLENRTRDDFVPVNAEAQEIERLFVPGAVDLVTMLDVLEHFERDDAIEALRQSRTVARRRVVVFTPRGEFPQDAYDPFDMGGEELQRHRSSWEPEDLLDLGMNVAILTDFHGPSNASFVEAFGTDAAPVDALLAWTN